MAWYKDSPAVFALTYTNENEEANDHHALSRYRFPRTQSHGVSMLSSSLRCIIMRARNNPVTSLAAPPPPCAVRVRARDLQTSCLQLATQTQNLI